MTNINIRFNGTANFKEVRAQIAALNTEFDTLNNSMRANARGIGPVAYKGLAKDINMARKEAQMMITSTGQFTSETVRVKSATASFNEQLAKQKVRLGDIFKQQRVVREAYKEQLALRSAVGAMYSKGASGNIEMDIYVPERGLKSLDTARHRLGYLGQLLSSTSLQLQNWGKNTQWAGRQLMVGFTVPTMIAAGAAGKFAYDIDKALTKVVKVYDNGADGVHRTTEQIRQDSIDTAKAVVNAYGQSAKQTIDISAELAAAGRAGNDLRQQTIQVSRAMMLGDLDQEQALKTVMTLQSAYKLSTKDMADTWNMFNSIENQTVLQMDDITEALPRVSGVMKSLGVDIKDTVVMLTAFRQAGIDAVEGATALKSISFKINAPSKQASKQFQELTGINYQDILEEGRGDVMKTIELVMNAIKGLSKIEQVSVIKELIGIHQGSKFFALAQALMDVNDGATQVGRAMKVTKQNTEDWAKTAQGEVEQLRKSISNRFLRAVEAVKLELADMGMVILKIITPAVEFFARFFKWINNLDEGKKKLLLASAAFIAIAGPVTMLAGLFMNLVATTGRLVAGLLKAVVPFQVMNAEQAAAAIAADKTTMALQEEKTLVDSLSLAFADLRASITAATRASAFPDLYHVPGAGGKPVVMQRNTEGPDTIANPSRAKAYNTVGVQTEQMQASAAKAERNWAGIAKGAAATVMSLSLMGSMIGADGTLGKIIDGTFMASMVATALPTSVFRRFGQETSKAFSAAGRGLTSLVGKSALATSGITAMKNAATKVRTQGFAKLSGFVMGPWGAAMGAAIAGVIYLHNRHQKQLEETRRLYGELRDSAKGWADALGFEYTDRKYAAITDTGPSVKKIEDNIKALKESNRATFDMLREASAKTHNEKLGLAIEQGMQVALHGGTPKQAHQAALLAMRIMRDDISQADLRVEINARVNFKDPQDQLNAYKRKYQQAIDDIAAIQPKKVPGDLPGMGAGPTRRNGR